MVNNQKKHRVAPGVGHSIIPDLHVWNIQGLQQEEIMIATMKWKMDILNKVRLPKRKTAHRFHLNILKSA